jgi:DNA-binding transcriptional MerR regulator
MENSLPAIPAKRYFTIGEVSDLCGVKPYVLRYWEQEFLQLKPVKRRGNRRYYQHHEVLLIRRIRELLYDQGFTISGARNQLGDHHPGAPIETGPEADPIGPSDATAADGEDHDSDSQANSGDVPQAALAGRPEARPTPPINGTDHGARYDTDGQLSGRSTTPPGYPDTAQLRTELLAIRDLLAP